MDVLSNFAIHKFQLKIQLQHQLYEQHTLSKINQTEIKYYFF